MAKSNIGHHCLKSDVLLWEDMVNNLSFSKTAAYPNFYKANPSDIAYIIFTSGSTGTPKGIKITSKSVANTLQAVSDLTQTTEADRLFNVSQFNFDLSIFDCFSIFLKGSSVYVPSQSEVDSPQCWANIVYTYKITIWNSVPEVFQLLLSSSHEDTINCLRVILNSGDRLSINTARQADKKINSEKLIYFSLGGATETSIWSIFHQLDLKNNRYDAIVPYGRPLPNQRFYILDNFNSILPPGCVGQLAIAGAGLAKGYLSRKENEQSFKTLYDTQERVYLTGDKGVLCPNAFEIFFLGRKNYELKVNGLRVDSLEIDAALTKTKLVERSITTILPNLYNKNELITYYVPSNLLSTRSLLKKWTQIYNELYQEEPLELNPFAGWVSPFDRALYDQSVMENWASETIKKIKPYLKGNVLEIGCGSGIISDACREFCKEYIACDISDEVINQLKRQNKHKNLYFYVSDASALLKDFLAKDKQFDLIIFNSVIQYFPNEVYCEEVLNIASKIIKTNGKIFLEM